MLFFLHMQKSSCWHQCKAKLHSASSCFITYVCNFLFRVSLMKWSFSSSNPSEFNNSLPELLCSDDDSGNEDVLDMEYTEAEAENLKRNAEVLNFLLPCNICFGILHRTVLIVFMIKQIICTVLKQNKSSASTFLLNLSSWTNNNQGYTEPFSFIVTCL